MSKKFGYLLLGFFLFLFSPFLISAAGSASFSLSGNSSVYVGNNVDVTLSIGSITSPILTYQAELSYDTNYLEFVSSTPLGLNSSYTNSSRMILGFSMTPVSSNTQLVKLTFKTKKAGSTTVGIRNSEVSDLNSVVLNSNNPSKTITISNPPSSNNNLSSLSVSSGSISFNKNTTSYSVTVGSSVTSVNISASAEDGGASVSGTGSKSLNYGNNSFSIVVTAPSGAKKTYTVNVNRKDDRSSNNNLSSLKVNGGDLNPGFSKGTTTYTLDVPYSISNLSVTAKAEHSKAKVTVSGNNNLVAEETTPVTITVTAENGSKKTYTINVKRGKDPNKKLSDNNYLTKLNPSIGILSPVFDKEKSDYEIWLPYEVDKISFDYQVEDTKYATTKLEGIDTLQPGISNIYKIIVKAESEKERTYTINVRRAKNPSDNSSSNTYIKSIKLKNGKLTSEFDKKNREYTYTKKSGFEITEVIPEDENSAVSIVKQENNIYLVVTSSSGEYGVYTLKEKRLNIVTYLIYIGIFACGLGVGFVVKSILRKKNIEPEKKKNKYNNKKC